MTEQDVPYLTPAEKRILLELATGESDSKIARRVFLSVRTVQWHCGNLREKFKVANRTQVILAAVRYGLIQLS